MSGVVSPSPQSLRERRRRQTSIDIHNVALRLVLERGGVDKVTVEEISSAAGLSSRTFFNYFSAKEYAIAYAPLEIPPEMAANFIAMGRAPAPVLLADVLDLTIRNLAENPPSREEMGIVFAMAHSSAAVASAVLTQFDEFQEQLSVLVAQRAGMKPTDEVPTLIAALVLAVGRTGMTRWVAESPTDGEDTPVPYLQRAAKMVQTFFAKPAD
ncbi:hypothetical protein A5625_10610 [Mycobacterium sp. 1465703.0]|nr:hypothetical protein A5625_10610 [Mycobacterium sp. 1465703.0]